MTVLNNHVHAQVLNRLLSSYSVAYITVETKYTIHHIEKLMGSIKDRGKWKWIAEIKSEYWDNVDKCKEAQRSHIDHQDMFPRFMFLTESMVNELIAFCEVRMLDITEIKTPKI